jgi:2'-5' RNA ligase
MSREADKYSLWIVPHGEAGEATQSLVNKLADENGTAHFVPHLTLVANIFAGASELEGLLGRTKRCAERLGPFLIKLTDYGYLDEEFRSLYLLAEGPELESAYESVSECFPQVSDEHFQAMPHMSVLYGNHPEKLKRQIIASNPLSPVEFTVKSIDLYLTNGPAEEWQLTQSFPLSADRA